MLRFILTGLISLLLTIGTYAQNGSIKGFVYDKGNGEPVIFTNVYLENTTHGIATDVNGYYNLSQVPPGDYKLMVSYIGYETLVLPISLGPNEVKTQNLYLIPSNVQIDDVEVSAERQELQTAVRTAVIKVSPKQISKIPTIGAQPDIAQYMQVLPGVVFTGDQGGQLYIRGGLPIQNLVLLDGMTIYNPFHSIGLFSVFDSDIMRNADIYTGAFPAQYGGRISSVMDITMRDGNKRRHAGKFTTNTFGSKILLEGPLLRMGDNGNTGLSYIVSAKTSYLDQTSKALYSYIEGGGLPFSFTDIYSKVSLNSNGGSKVSLFGFNFRDQVNYRNVSNLGWNSAGAGANIVLVPGMSDFLIKANFSYSHYDIQFQEINQLPAYSSIDGFKAGLDFTYFLGDNSFNYGLEAMGNSTSYEFYNSIGRKIGSGEEVNTTELAGYATYKWSSGKWLVEPGLRLHYYAFIPYASFEPRLGVKYKYSDHLRFKMGAGIYSQNLVSAISDRDVVNLFYGFLSGSYNLQREFQGSEPLADLQTAQHLIGGFEFDFNKHWMLQVEGYIKYNPQIIVLNRNKLFNDSPANIDQPDYFKKDFILETGNAYGVDFLLKYDHKQTYLWFVYSLGKVTRFDGVYDYAPIFDRRHNVNLVASYIFGDDLSWEINGRWNLGSGFPTLQNQGFYEQLTFTDGIAADYTSDNGLVGVLYTSLDQKVRLPYYHRFDLTLKREIAITTNSTLEASFSVTNVYNRENIFYFDRVSYERVNQLPILPSLGASYTF